MAWTRKWADRDDVARTPPLVRKKNEKKRFFQALKMRALESHRVKVLSEVSDGKFE